MQVETIDSQQVIYVIVSFPSKWIIADDIEEKFNVMAKLNGKANGNCEYVFVTEFDNGFDAIFDAIEYNISIMLAAQERADLLQKKVFELRELFEQEDMTLEMLRTLEFSWKGKKKAIATKQKKQEEIIEETEETNND